jgi:dTDP-4-dehydrorhamnose 3,5-epimerase
MRFDPLPLPGAFVVAPERHTDERGYFARTFCSDEFAARGLAGSFVQCSTSFNVRRGTLRGMHYQRPPHEEAKLVRCTRGVVLDVLLHRASGRWHAVELSEQNGLAVYIPAGFAHGFQTLLANCEVFYQMAMAHHPAAAAVIRWDDPAYAIAWPIWPPILSEWDAGHE